MKKINEKLETLIEFEYLEQGAINQIWDALALPFLKKLVIMPDCHQGYSLPIGGVALLDGVISPAYTGYDIGCGMCFVETDIDADELDEYEKQYIFTEIYERIPVGFDSRNTGINYKVFESNDKELTKKVASKLCIQLGTLGGGNHFIEIGVNRKGKICVTIHSGSRNMGHSIASYWMELSKNVDKNFPNGFLDLNSIYGQEYLKNMIFAQDYALENRKIMMEEVLKILGCFSKKLLRAMVNENHNHAIVTENGVLHRKGATPSDKDQIGIIPGNMRDGVYITKGLGNEKYLSSSSHGAGRKFSRKQAKKDITFSSFCDSMEGIIAKVDENHIDESCFAYKDLDFVINKQNGIVVDVIDKVKPLINVKG